jgi:indolepyruvate ferredoxin oxidoreductase beta subunit
VKYNVLLTGVGGQGLMLLSTIIGEACTTGGVKVVVQEQHGLAQRSGSISAHVRIGDAYSPMIPIGEADMIVAMEAAEALRYVEYLKPGGAVVMNSRMMHPVIETNELVKRRRENLPYVTLDQVTGQLMRRTDRIYALDASALAAEAGNPRTENVVLMGAASRVGGFPLSREALLEAVKRAVPERTVAANVAAFELGERAVG